MAKGAGSSGGDWTAGIVAIVAALLLGGALPIGLYFGLYMPKEKERLDAVKKLDQLNIDMEMMLARGERVRGLEEDGSQMEERVKEIETPFALGDAEKLDVPDVRATLLRLAEKHQLALRPERQQQLGAEVVFTGGDRITFEKGLHATKLQIEAKARFHDFGRFVTEMETLEQFVIIPESLVCTGDANGGNDHVFIMVVYVVERRDVDAIGR
ncbi:MAG: hypothetical protein ICCCNLDF_01231 [Planctomycetes bacterium]|nr:hypothetical protein [Planctomycetota bacterium]